jgi:formate hydrogenlyase subunit 4
MALEIFLNILIILFFPFLFLGIITKVKAFWAGRIGPSIIQPFFDFLKLMKKGEVISLTTTFIFKISPSLILASIVIAALTVPMAGHRSIISFNGDFILFAYILALGKFFNIISGLDTGSSFEGMGSSREATISTLVEPAFFIILSALSLAAGKLSFAELFSVLNYNNLIFLLIIVLSVIIFFIMMLVEGCRVPIDDPNTHLELTMIHEVMILDNSGIDLGFLFYANGMKLVVYGSIIANLIIPSGLNYGLGFVCFLLVLFCLSVLIGIIESLIARLRMNHILQFIFLMTSFSLIVLSVIVLSFNGGIK